MTKRTRLHLRVAKKTSSKVALGIAKGYRSGLEEQIARQLQAAGVDALYEETRIPFVEPAKARKYTPDWVLPNGIIIESKGRFVTADRQKHLYVKALHPHLDIRFVFPRSPSKISKPSPTTYASPSSKNGFKAAYTFILP